MDANEKRLKRMSAGITLLLGVLLLLAAWRPPEMIIWLNLLAFGGPPAGGYRQRHVLETIRNRHEPY
ncbi:hypothetical protein FK514_30105 [Klebsiella pneumoniae]|nr:hypothetical protein [Klebsiella pneumoniae]